MAVKKADAEEVPAPEPQPEPVPAPDPEPEPVAEVPGWPGVVPETAEEHDARRRAEAAALA